MHPTIARGIYWPTFGWNLLLGRVLKIRHWWDYVDDSVILGARPLRRDIPTLAHKHGVVGIVNMCEEFKGDAKACEENGIEQLWLPTTDFNPPSVEMISRGVEFIQSKVAAGGRVYVHCKAGRARSATVVICWLVKYRNLTLEEAQKHLSRCRPHVHAQLPKRQVVQQYCNLLPSPRELRT